MPCCSSAPVVVDVEVDENVAYLEKLGKAIKHFDKSIVETLTLFQQLVKSYETVAGSFVEVSAGNDAQTQEAVKNFESNMVKLKDGTAVSTLQLDMSRSVRDPMEPVRAQREHASKICKALLKLKKKCESQRRKLAETETKYAKKNKSLAESKSYKKAGEKRNKLQNEYAETKLELAKAVDELKRFAFAFLSKAVPGYAATTRDFTMYLGNALGNARDEWTHVARVTEPPHDSHITPHAAEAPSAPSAPSSRGQSQSPTIEEQYYKSQE